uniref:Uncharacterized protein n=1 Tax=Globodera rostochiensis TaxID=31243 RepID=A0A914H7W0_GLORO
MVNPKNPSSWKSALGFVSSLVGASSQEPQFSPSMHDTSAASSFYPSNQPDDQTLESMSRREIKKAQRRITEESNGLNKESGEESNELNKSEEESNGLNKESGEESNELNKSEEESNGLNKSEEESNGLNKESEEESNGLNKESEEESNGLNKESEEESKQFLAEAHQNLLKHQYDVAMQSVPVDQTHPILLRQLKKLTGKSATAPTPPAACGGDEPQQQSSGASATMDFSWILVQKNPNPDFP